jgi:hypothetical protein
MAGRLSTGELADRSIELTIFFNLPDYTAAAAAVSIVVDDRIDTMMFVLPSKLIRSLSAYLH